MSRKSQLKQPPREYPGVRNGSKKPTRAATKHGTGTPHLQGDGAAEVQASPAPERIPYVRVRLPKNNTSFGAPWRYFYLVPQRALQAFVSRGMAHVSYPVTVVVEATDVKVNGHTVGTSGNAGNVFRAGETVHLVVPLRRTADLVPHQTLRRSKSQKDKPWEPQDILSMRQRVPKEVTLHTADGSQRLCTACQFFHMMELGQCTPGLRDCSEGVILPVSEILKKRKDTSSEVPSC